jgi:hypothetical protein
MTFRALLISILIALAIIFAIVYPILQEMQHVTYMHQQRIMDYSEEVRRQCALAWPYKQERCEACVHGALRSDI